MDKKTERKIRVELMKPFPNDAILFRPDKRTSTGSYIVVPYLDVRYIVYRLNVMIPGDWELHVDVKPLTLKHSEDNAFVFGHMATAKLTILGRTMTGTGSSYLLNDVDIDKLKRQEVKIDPKSAETDAIRRAAANHSIGLYLWFYKKPIFVDDLSELSNPLRSTKLQQALKEIKELGERLYRQALEYKLDYQEETNE